MDASSRIIGRKPRLEDKGFILKSWLMGNYWGNWYFNQMDQDLYYKVYTAHIHGLLLDPTTKVEIACMEENPDMTYGFIVWQKNVLIWAFVKPEYRNQGILNFLLQDKGIKFTQSTTKPGSAITRKKGWLFNPFILQEQK